MEQINITALRHSAFYSPLLMTIKGGFLEEEGLKPNYQPATSDMSVPDEIGKGNFHLAQSAVATSFETLENGGECDIVHFAQINERDGFFIASREPRPDFKWKDLVDREVLVDHFFQPLAMLKYGLYRQGIDFNALRAIDAGDVTAIDQAFRDGQGDYVHMQGPAPQQLEKEGIGYVVAAVGDAVGPVAFSSLCAKRDWLETDMAHTFMRAYRKARDYVIEAPAEEIAHREADFFPDIDTDVLQQTIAAYQKLGCWTVDPVISHQAYDNLLEVFMQSGGITRRHPYASCIVPPPDAA
ncbi:MAG: ABC transporter substrate-binding protein [Gammaproteobacteria bacterium]|nr:MAG: ABC transporter substrate-binding protein [Gammaproteobacteria bacterium]